MSRYWKFSRLSVVFVIASLILAGTACGEGSKQSKPDQPEKILFIGTSLTYYNGGLEYHIMQLANSADPPLDIQANSVTRSGSPLRMLWKYTEARDVILEGNYDVVVLQDALPLSDVDTFHEYTRLFVEDIKTTGAEPVLFMTWARNNYSTEEIAQAFVVIAKELGLVVAPVGLAWQYAMEERPDLDLYKSDNIHPNIHGSYITINVIYATIFGENPVGLTYFPSGEYSMTEDEAAFLQRIAWETVQDYQAQD